MPAQKPSDTYNPLYFLASVGAGGLAVTFFMYLMFWVPHPGRPVPIFEDIMPAFATGGLWLQVAIVIAMIGIAGFAFLNFKALAWNFMALTRFKKTESYAKLMQSNGQTTLLAAPLAVAMSINAGFIIGLVFVPKLWTIVEFLFPLAIVAFVLNGIWALRLIGGFLARVLREKAFESEANNSFAQVLPAFALSMTAVGLAAPAAMSGIKTVVATSLILSTFFGTLAVIYALLAMAAAMGPILRNGVAREAAPTLMIAVPLVTILSIMVMRQNHGLHEVFGAHAETTDTLMFLAKGIAIQVIFLMLGIVVMRAQGYFKDFVMGDKTSPGSYALVCPGVAFAVLMHFFVNKGLVAAGVIDKFDPAFWIITGFALLAQFAMVALVLRLNRQHFSAPHAAAVPAE